MGDLGVDGLVDMDERCEVLLKRMKGWQPDVEQRFKAMERPLSREAVSPPGGPNLKCVVCNGRELPPPL